MDAFLAVLGQLFTILFWVAVVSPAVLALALLGLVLFRPHGTVSKPAAPQAGEIYRHYKGDLYEVVGMAEHAEDASQYVVYRRQGDTAIWVRPVEHFIEVDIFRGRRQARFAPAEAAEAA